jgi:hypothetical protein
VDFSFLKGVFTKYRFPQWVTEKSSDHIFPMHESKKAASDKSFPKRGKTIVISLAQYF